MGAWGDESYSNDGCCDALGEVIEDIYNFSQGDANKCLKRNFDIINKQKEIETYDKQDFLGCVVWILNQDKKVAKKYLMSALSFAEEMLSSKEYLETWCSPSSRKYCLRKEIRILKKALKKLEDLK